MFSLLLKKDSKYIVDFMDETKSTCYYIDRVMGAEGPSEEKIEKDLILNHWRFKMFHFKSPMVRYQ